MWIACFYTFSVVQEISVLLSASEMTYIVSGGALNSTHCSVLLLVYLS